MDKGKQFAIWLDGFLDGKTSLDEKQTEALKTKLNSIFDHDAMDSITEDKQDGLNWPPDFKSTIDSYPLNNNGEELMRC